MLVKWNRECICLELPLISLLFRASRRAAARLGEETFSECVPRSALISRNNRRQFYRIIYIYISIESLVTRYVRQKLFYSKEWCAHTLDITQERNQIRSNQKQEKDRNDIFCHEQECTIRIFLSFALNFTTFFNFTAALFCKWFAGLFQLSLRRNIVRWYHINSFRWKKLQHHKTSRRGIILRIKTKKTPVTYGYLFANLPLEFTF